MKTGPEERAELMHQIKTLYYHNVPPIIPAKSDSNMDVYENIESLVGKSWDELSFGVFHDNMYAFLSLPNKAVPYYLGAMMYSSLENNFFENDALLLILSCPASGKAGKKRVPPSVISGKINACLTDQQRKCFSSYLRYIRNFVGASWQSRVDSSISELG